MDELFTSLNALSRAAAEPSGWEYASIIIGALGAIALWAFLAFFRKGGEKRKPGETIKNFFCSKATLLKI